MRARELIRYAESHGWYFVRRGGRQSHTIFKHPGYPYQIAIPDHVGKDIAKGTLEQILKQIHGTWKGSIR